MKFWKGFGTGLAAAVLAIGCSSSDSLMGDDGTTKFSNESSSTVTVAAAEDEKFGSFTLGPGQSKKVDRMGSHMDYTFTSSGPVENIEIEEIEVIFTDPINL